MRKIAIEGRGFKIDLDNTYVTENADGTYSFCTADKVTYTVKANGMIVALKFDNNQTVTLHDDDRDAGIELSLEEAVLVSNVKGSSRYKRCLVCGDWRDHWKHGAYETAYGHCRVLTDSQKGISCSTGAKIVGGHVKIDGFPGWFIVPICDTCNKKFGAKLVIDSSVTFVRAVSRLPFCHN